MKRKWIIIVLTNLLLYSTGAYAEDYWISFTGASIEFGTGRTELPDKPGKKYLMRINQIGNILTPAKVLTTSSIPYKPSGYGATALWQDSTKLHLWITDAVSHLFRMDINKRTLNIISFRRLNVTCFSPQQLAVTQRSRDNYLVFQKSTPENLVYQAIGISDKGAILPFRRVIASPAFPEEMGISSDGHVFFYEKGGGPQPNNGAFVLQKVDAQGNLLGRPVTAVKGYVKPVDVSHTLVGNRRFILYQNHVTHRQLYLQAVNASSLSNIGDPVRIVGNTGFGWHSAAIDPLGHFVIVVTSTGLYFQALDATGHPSGLPKFLSNQSGGGIDILKDVSGNQK